MNYLLVKRIASTMLCNFDFHNIPSIFSKGCFEADLWKFIENGVGCNDYVYNTMNEILGNYFGFVLEHGNIIAVISEKKFSNNSNLFERKNTSSFPILNSSRLKPIDRKILE